MITFKQFISEASNGILQPQTEFQTLELIAEEIKNKCSDFVKASGGKPVFRGMGGPAKKSGDFFFTPTPKGRRPTDSDPELNFIMNAGLDAAFGVGDVRQNCFFGTGDQGIAQDYGKIYYIFPTNGFQYLYAKELVDPYGASTEIIRNIADSLNASKKFPDTDWSADAVELLFHQIYANIGFKDWQKGYDEGFKNSETLLKNLNIILSTTFKKEHKPVSIRAGALAIGQALEQFGKRYYKHMNDLKGAIFADTEIMFFDCSGYYAIATDNYDYPTILKLLK